MREACSLVWLALVGLFRSRASLEAEILILRHQLNIQRRQSPKRLNFSTLDRLIFAGLYRLAPSVLGALAILKPETVIRWHRAGFRSYWRWKSRPRGGRPTVPLEIRELIREMSIANPLWGAPRTHGELLKLGIRNRTDQRGEVYGQAERPAVPGSEDVPPQSCRWHRGDGSVRRTDDLISLALWLVPRYLIRDRDGAYGEVFIRRVRSMGIRDRPTSPRSPWQNACAERLIGSIRRECLDYVVVLGERHLRHVLLSYMNYYNETRTHLSLDKDAPLSRTVQRAGRILRLPILGGLHHQYIRI